MPCPAALALQSLAGTTPSACKAQAADALPADTASFKTTAAAVVLCCLPLLFVAGLLPLGAIGAALPGNVTGPSSSIVAANSVASAAPVTRGRPITFSHSDYLQTFCSQNL